MQDLHCTGVAHEVNSILIQTWRYPESSLFLHINIHCESYRWRATSITWSYKLHSCTFKATIKELQYRCIICLRSNIHSESTQIHSFLSELVMLSLCSLRLWGFFSSDQFISGKMCFALLSHSLMNCFPVKCHQIRIASRSDHKKPSHT